MDAFQKALWYVETHLGEKLSLEEIARHAGLSPFHLSRGFAEVSGKPLMRYVRARRLSEAARALATGAPNILSVALDAGYSSHEAFTRAFRDAFDITPEQARLCPNKLALTGAISMDTTPLTTLADPRFETITPLLVAGISARYQSDDIAGIPAQWQRLQPFHGTLPMQVGQTAYGVCYNFDDDSTFDYLCGWEVSDFSGLPKALASLRLAPQRYAVFRQPGHISTIRGAFAAIWSKWFPASGQTPADAPTFEKYGPDFDGETGHGGFEIWVPVKG